MWWWSGRSDRESMGTMPPRGRISRVARGTLWRGQAARATSVARAASPLICSAGKLLALQVPCSFPRGAIDEQTQFLFIPQHRAHVSFQGGKLLNDGGLMDQKLAGQQVFEDLLMQVHQPT
jgi:hypothetical protein